MKKIVAIRFDTLKKTQPTTIKQIVPVVTDIIFTLASKVIESSIVIENIEIFLIR